MICTYLCYGTIESASLSKIAHVVGSPPYKVISFHDEDEVL